MSLEKMRVGFENVRRQLRLEGSRDIGLRGSRPKFDGGVPKQDASGHQASSTNRGADKGYWRTRVVRL